MSYVSTVLAETGLVGFWELAEPSGTTATDQTGIQDGTYTNVSGITLGQTGIAGGGGATATRFTAANSGYVNIPTVLANIVTDVFTVEQWVKRTTTGATEIMFCDDSTAKIKFYFNSSNKNILHKSNSSQIFASVTTLTDTSSFHHIVVTKNGSTVKLYLDAADITPTITNSAFAVASGNYTIGRDQGGGNYQNGTMQFVALYNVALTSGQVSNHYTLGSAAGAAANGGFFGLMSKAHREWERRKSGILVPRLWTPEPAYTI